MNSISRAVTSRFNDISNKRQRLVGEGKDSDFGNRNYVVRGVAVLPGQFELHANHAFYPTAVVNPSWTDPTTSSFNCFEPPELIISEEAISEKPTLSMQTEVPKLPAEPKATNNISKKVTSVVRRLSPFGSSSNLSKDKDEDKHDANDEKKSQKIFKETRGKMDRIKKSFKTNERQQLIDSDEEQ